MDAARSAVTLEALQFSAKIGGVLVAQIAVFLQRAINNFLELGRNIRIQAHRRDRFAIQDSFEHYTGSISTKREGARGHFVEHHPGGEKSGGRETGQGAPPSW